MPWEKAIDYERDLQAICFATEDAQEGRAAFAEKRAPETGGLNHRPRTSLDTLARTSDRVSRDTVAVTALPGRERNHSAIGWAQNLAKRHNGSASGSVSWLTSALVSHRSVSGSRLCPP